RRRATGTAATRSRRARTRRWWRSGRRTGRASASAPPARLGGVERAPRRAGDRLRRAGREGEPRARVLREALRKGELGSDRAKARVDLRRAAVDREAYRCEQDLAAQERAASVAGAE